MNIEVNLLNKVIELFFNLCEMVNCIELNDFDHKL